MCYQNAPPMLSGTDVLLRLCLFLLPVSALAQAPAAEALLQKAYGLHEEGLDYDYANQPAKAIEAYDQALQLRKQAIGQYGITADTVLEGIIKGYFNIGDSWQYLGHYGRMQSYLDSCELVLQQFEQSFGFYSPYRRSKLYHGLGQLYRRVAGPERAIVALQQAHYYCGEDKSQPWYFRQFDQAQMMNDISAAYVEWKTAPDSIIHYAQAALQQLAPLRGVPDLTERRVQEARASALINLAYGYQLNGEPKASEDRFLEARDLLEGIRADVEQQLESGTEDQAYLISDFGYLGEALNNAVNGLSITIAHTGRYREAEALLQSSIVRDENLRALRPEFVQASLLLSSDYHNLAEIYYLQGRYQEALDYNEQAMRELQPPQEAQPGQQDFYVHNDLYWIEALTGKARCIKQLGQVEDARLAAETGLAHISQIRKNYLDGISRRALGDKVKSLTEVAIWAALQPPEPDVELAFSYAERSKIFTLLEAIRDHRKSSIAGLDEDLLNREYALRRSIARTKETIRWAQSRQSQSELREQLAQQQEELKSLLRKLEGIEAYQQLYFGRRPVTALEAQKSLRKNQAMISYFVGEEHTVAFLLQKGSALRFFQLDLPEERLGEEVKKLLLAIRYSYQKDLKEKEKEGFPPGHTVASLEQQLLQSAQWIYRHSMQPILREVDGDRLVLLPDGPLHRLPFSVLVKPDPNTIAGAYHQYQYLGEQYSLSYCYAATLLEEMRRSLKQPGKATLAFAPSFGGPLVASRGEGLGELPFSAAEVKEVCEKVYCQPEAFVNDRARKEKFLKHIERQAYAFVHMATHSKANHADPGSSFISFTQESNQSIDPQQLLYLRELYGLSMQVETVVLSSCETNLGPLIRGTGMLSLTRGFAFAGAKCIVSSLWAVNGQSTKLLMSHFYDAIKKGLPRDQALQYAKKKLRSKSGTRHPYYWAAFIPVGKVTPSKDYSIYWLTAALGGFGFLFILFWRRQRGGKQDTV